MNIMSYKICNLVIRIPALFFKIGYMQSPYENLNSAQFCHPENKRSIPYSMPGVNNAICLRSTRLKGQVLTWKAHPSLFRTQLFMTMLLTNASKAHFYRASVPAVVYREVLHVGMQTLPAPWPARTCITNNMVRKQLEILGRWHDSAGKHIKFLPSFLGISSKYRQIKGKYLRRIIFYNISIKIVQMFNQNDMTLDPTHLIHVQLVLKIQMWC